MDETDQRNATTAGTQALGCAVSGIMAAFFLPLTILILMFLSIADEQYQTKSVLWLIAGWTYLLGSFFAFMKSLSFPHRLLTGIILNAIGAFFWVPALPVFDAEKDLGGLWIVLPSLILTAIWISFLYLSRPR